MKKFALFLAPLMAISFLTNCNNGPKQYTVTFDLNGGTSAAIPTQTVTEGEKATKPKDPSRNEDSQGIYTFNEWQLNGNKFDFHNSIADNITLKANWNMVHKYSVTVGTHDHLSFTATDGKDLSTIKAIEGQDFKFKMEAINEEGSTDYLVPTSLEIKINDGPSLAGGYTITPTADEKEAEVSINADKVVGNIVIFGKAAENLKYSYKVSAYDGLNLSIPDEGKQDKNQNLTITFTTKDKESSNDKYKLPKKENIFIEFDNVNGKKEWISPAMNDSVIQQEYCEYNEQSGALTIKTNHIKNNIDIKTRANDYPLLEKLSWEQINGYSLAGWAPYIFYIGEEKIVQIDDEDHRVRILDTNHDDLISGVKAGITFEFVDTVLSYYIKWDNYDDEHPDFISSNLNHALNHGDDCFFRILPENLQKIIKDVNKKVGIYESSTKSFVAKIYSTKLFPLAYYEMFDENPPGRSSIAPNEGTRYQYYIEHSKIEDRIKRDTKKYIQNYWIRSPDAFKEDNDIGDVFYVNELGGIERVEPVDIANIAPAFCI